MAYKPLQDTRSTSGNPKMSADDWVNGKKKEKSAVKQGKTTQTGNAKVTFDSGSKGGGSKNQGNDNTSKPAFGGKPKGTPTITNQDVDRLAAQEKGLTQKTNRYTSPVDRAQKPQTLDSFFQGAMDTMQQAQATRMDTVEDWINGAQSRLAYLKSKRHPGLDNPALDQDIADLRNRISMLQKGYMEGGQNFATAQGGLAQAGVTGQGYLDKQKSANQGALQTQQARNQGFLDQEKVKAGSNIIQNLPPVKGPDGKVGEVSPALRIAMLQRLFQSGGDLNSIFGSMRLGAGSEGDGSKKKKKEE